MANDVTPTNAMTIRKYTQYIKEPETKEQRVRNNLRRDYDNQHNAGKPEFL